MSLFKRRDTTTATGDTQPKKKFKVSSLFDGQMLISDGMREKLPYIFFIFFLIMAYINNSYTYEQRINERQRLQKQATDMKYRSTDIKTKLTTKGQRTQLLKHLEEVGSEVTNAQTQPIVIEK
ncbi:MAG: FtsL-like putative cell division protein [Bacteroidales bacterium]|nr:FtsL-like putative cell division protein [Bacteroidales bacterium]